MKKLRGVLNGVVTNYNDCLFTNVLWDQNATCLFRNIRKVLTLIDSEFGENMKLWSEGLSYFHKETQKEVWGKFKEFDNK